ncbi:MULTISPECIES: cbb3-type cytochrome oxidase assembly protein CcoS [Marinobacter]|uniref:cbb3-type cytochrome oxidase assembly protein CcoS n=1 Tax=Marinobacter TaxID=2742 RepID=UPI0007DA2641|nr:MULTISPECIES: cbb3-type cytochrome oxidase assembly protein CcoS [unclassified Marinobacter]MBL3825381.1 cbb3-type cytochrome oxidase assembly protein CcoS [Marinobacter sp. MC3]MBL3893887.1 cbb3-type cytochrome oxidase assembly protein CcoS [Marinobacter sp. MW3]OAN90443.1 cytochrome oxidase maturation protein, cbb3-type [Marinobacter sp. EhN04]OAN96838.1 cytochrome oxidase maturation protein, cbb3-type [Marinobacter sp. EhC06]
MQIVMFLVPVMLILVALGIVLFSWAVKNGQYDDLEGPAHRILYDDDKDMIPDDARTDKPAAEEQTSEQTADVSKTATPDEDKSQQG